MTPTSNLSSALYSPKIRAAPHESSRRQRPSPLGQTRTHTPTHTRVFVSPSSNAFGHAPTASGTRAAHPPHPPHLDRNSYLTWHPSPLPSSSSMWKAARKDQGTEKVAVATTLPPPYRPEHAESGAGHTGGSNRPHQYHQSRLEPGEIRSPVDGPSCPSRTPANGERLPHV